MSKKVCKNKIKIIIIIIITLLQVYIQKNKAGYIIYTMNCYPRKGQLRDLDFMRHKLYHPNQYQYSQQPILKVVLNISPIVFKIGLIRLLPQNPIKQVGLTIHWKTALIRNSDNIKYKPQKPCNERPILKSTDMLQTKSFIES